MRLAQIVLQDVTGAVAWEGGLRDFFYAHDYSHSERHDFCERLREVNPANGMREPLTEWVPLVLTGLPMLPYEVLLSEPAEVSP